VLVVEEVKVIMMLLLEQVVLGFLLAAAVEVLFGMQ
jgi:hypothetical protein